MENILFTLCLITLSPVLIFAQFNSGSTGADGALDLSTMTCPNNNCKIQLPESGVLNYTTINVPAGKTLRFLVNSVNTPAILLAQSNVVINGTVDVSSVARNTCGGIPLELAPGGFRGGTPNRPGFGAGAGQSNGEAGKWVGPLSLSPIVGGSGGAGTVISIHSFDGGSGGGAIILASSTAITGSGIVKAKGSSNSNCNAVGSSGSGGAIRLVSNTINFSGNFDACSGNCGVVRLEATSLTFTGSSTPLAVHSPINPNIILAAVPQLAITSIGGYSVPSYAGSRFDLIDLLLPNQLPDPINVVVTATNVPVGTQVQVGFANGSPNGNSTPCSLAGTFGNSSCTATISNLNRTGGTYLLATAIFLPPASLAQYNQKGENQVAKIKLEAALGGKPKYLFLRSDGNVIDQKKISPQFLQQFGM